MADKANIRTKYYAFSDLAQVEDLSGDVRQSARQYMTLYETARRFERPVILELGTHHGRSTTMFLQACAETGGHVYSVDINDYSDIALDNPHWAFIQSDSTQIDAIIALHPLLADGIDVLLIDSLHKPDHVERELMGWAPYLKKGAVIFFDDVDPFPYRKGQRKDNVGNEFDWEAIGDFVIATFRANLDQLDLDVMMGSTGLAVMTKRSEMGTPLNKPCTITYRTRDPLWRMYRKIRALIRGKA